MTRAASPAVRRVGSRLRWTSSLLVVAILAVPAQTLVHCGLSFGTLLDGRHDVPSSGHGHRPASGTRIVSGCPSAETCASRAELGLVREDRGSAWHAWAPSTPTRSDSSGLARSSVARFVARSAPHQADLPPRTQPLRI
jgi:hypothetical protein